MLKDKTLYSFLSQSITLLQSFDKYYLSINCEKFMSQQISPISENMKHCKISVWFSKSHFLVEDSQQIR